MILLAKICLPLDTVTNATSDSTNSLCCEIEGSIVPSHRACKRHWKDSWNRVKPKRERNIKVLLDQSWPSLNMSQSSMFGEISDDLSFPWSSSVHCTRWKLWQTHDSSSTRLLEQLLLSRFPRRAALERTPEDTKQHDTIILETSTRQSSRSDTSWHHNICLSKGIWL